VDTSVSIGTHDWETRDEVGGERGEWCTGIARKKYLPGLHVMKSPRYREQVGSNEGGVL
jgi:hypothetical protein